MLDRQVAFDANDDEDEDGRCVTKRMDEVISFAKEVSKDPTATKKRERIKT